MNYNIDLVCGDDFRLPIKIKDSSGLPMDLAGYTAKSQIRKASDNSLVTTFTIAIDSDTTTGAMVFSLTGVQTALFSPAGGYETYIYDLKINSATNPDKRILRGGISAVVGVTQDV